MNTCQTLCLLIRNRLLNESSILKLSYVNKMLNLKYKEYVKNIRDIEILFDDINDILANNKIITFHKYYKVIHNYWKSNLDNDTIYIYYTDSSYIISKFCYILIKNIDSTSYTSPFFIIPSALRYKNVKFVYKFVNIMADKYPEIFPDQISNKLINNTFISLILKHNNVPFVSEFINIIADKYPKVYDKFIKNKLISHNNHENDHTILDKFISFSFKYKNVTFVREFMNMMTSKYPEIYDKLTENEIKKYKGHMKNTRWYQIYLIFHKFYKNFLFLLTENNTMTSVLFDNIYNDGHGMCITLANDIFDYVDEHKIKFNKSNIIYRNMLNIAVNFNDIVLFKKYFNFSDFPNMPHILDYDKYLKIMNNEVFLQYQNNVIYFDTIGTNINGTDQIISDKKYIGKIVIYISVDTIKNYDIYLQYMSIINNLESDDINGKILDIIKRVDDPAIIKYIYTNYKNIINEDVINDISIYTYVNIDIFRLFGPYLKFDKLDHILPELSDINSLTFEHLKYGIELISKISESSYSKKRYDSLLSECMYLELYHIGSNNKDSIDIIDYLIKLGVKYPVSSVQDSCYGYNIMSYCTIYFLDTIDYLLNNGYKFKYEHVVNLYKDLNMECYMKPKKFIQISKRMMKSLEPCY